MLANGRKKYPNYTLIEHDCTDLIDEKCDILVSMFGTPNYIGLSKLLAHYQHMKCKHAFFVFYNENYVDGIASKYHRYTQDELTRILHAFKPIVEPLNENYYIVKW